MGIGDRRVRGWVINFIPFIYPQSPIPYPLSAIPSPLSPIVHLLRLTQLFASGFGGEEGGSHDLTEVRSA